MATLTTAPMPVISGPARPLNPFLVVASLPLGWVMPRLAGRLWARSPLWLAAVIAFANTVGFWLIAQRYLRTFRMDPPEFIYATAGAVMGFVCVLIMLGFAALPFVPLPGPSRPVARHITRAVFFSSTQVYLWAGVLMLGQRLLPHLLPLRDIYDTLIFTLLLVAGLLVYTFVMVVLACVVEYRSPTDLPFPREPRCDDCGYDLRETGMASRCPECGKPVVDCLGDDVRKPIAWERDPSFLNLRLMARQFVMLIVQPLKLFRIMPITTGQGAARRWLCVMLVIVFAEAFWAIPSIHLIDENFGASMTSWTFWATNLSVAAIWTFLALMMVGIETAGVTFVSRYRKQPIDLSNASKVTCYASTMLFLWIILGTLQAGLLDWWVAVFHGPAKFPARVDSLFEVCTFGVAHIAGLVWFEYTVYRGLRAVMYAVR